MHMLISVGDLISVLRHYMDYKTSFTCYKALLTPALSASASVGTALQLQLVYEGTVLH